MFNLYVDLIIYSMALKSPGEELSLDVVFVFVFVFRKVNKLRSNVNTTLLLLFTNMTAMI